MAVMAPIQDSVQAHFRVMNFDDPVKCSVFTTGCAMSETLEEMDLIINADLKVVGT